jgi:type II secretory pathway pseudopilin PulG
MNRDNQKGFTLIELVLSMGFVSALLIAITLTIIQIGNSYTRGITLKEVNQVGRSLSVELQRNISSSTSFDVSSPEVFIEQVNPDKWGGRLCTGQYSYIWNYGKTLNAVSPGSNINEYVSTANPKISFIKVNDNAGLMCQVDEVTSALPDVLFIDSVELINAGDKNLAIHDFDITSISNDSTTAQQLYNISFTIGTNDDALIDAGNGNCKPPSATESSEMDFSYCAINRFDIIVRSGNVAG